MSKFTEGTIVFSPLNRRVAAVLGGVVLLALIGLLGWGPSVQVSWNPFASFTRSKAELSDESEHLDQKRLFILACASAKQRLAQDLASGRLTLLEAAARVHAIDEQNPDFNWDEIRKIIPACCDEERHCREAILLLRTWLPEDEETGAIVETYEAELLQHLAEGTLVLPDEAAV